MPTKPALQQFIEDFVGGSFTVAITTATVAASSTIVAANNFERMSLTFINVGSVNIALQPSIGVSSGAGVLLAANGGNVSLDAQEDLPLVGWSWFAAAASGTGSLMVIETIRYNSGVQPALAASTAAV